MDAGTVFARSARTWTISDKNLGHFRGNRRKQPEERHRQDALIERIVSTFTAYGNDDIPGRYGCTLIYETTAEY